MFLVINNMYFSYNILKLSKAKSFTKSLIEMKIPIDLNKKN
jgi:hypothetical protein